MCVRSSGLDGVVWEVSVHCIAVLRDVRYVIMSFKSRVPSILLLK